MIHLYLTGANEGQCMCGSGRFMAIRLSDEQVGGGLREELGLCSLCLERTGVSGRILGNRPRAAVRRPCESPKRGTMEKKKGGTRIELGGANGSALHPLEKG